MDIRPVAPGDRTLGGLDFFWLWAGVSISLAEIWAGGFLAPMGFWPALSAIVLGHLLGNTLMALGGVVGSDHGIPSMVSVRPSFGVRGSNLAAILNVIQLVCWASIMLIIGGRAGAMLGEPLGGIFASSRFWILVIGAGTLAWALFTGGKVWKVLQGVTVVGMLVVIVILSFETYRTFTTSPVARSAAASPLPFMSGLDLVIAMPISWMPLVADYSRFSRSGPAAFWNTWIGYFLVSSWMFVLGLMATLVTGTSEPHMQMLELMGAAGLAVPALLMVVFSTITSDFPDLYSATCSMLNVSERISAKSFLWITGIVSIIVALVFPMERYESFLYFIGAMFVPLFGIVLTDYFVIRKRELDLDALYNTNGTTGREASRAYWYRSGFNVSALVAWAVGFATYELIEALQYPIGASLPAIAVAAAGYYAMASLTRRNA